MRNGRINMPGITIVEASPVIWTDPEKLPAVPMVVELVLGTEIALQLPKGAPACNKSTQSSIYTSFNYIVNLL